MSILSTALAWIKGETRSLVVPAASLVPDKKDLSTGHEEWIYPRPPGIWTWPMVESMVLQHEQPSFYLSSMLCDSLRRDWLLAGLIDSRLKAFLKCKVEYIPEEEADLLEREFPRILSKSTQARILFWVIFEGFCICELKWDMKHLRPKVVPYHPSSCYYRTDTKTWQVMTRDQGLIDLVGPNAPGAGKWVIFKSEDEERPWMSGLIRAIGLLLVIHQATFVDWAKHSRTMASPTKVLTVPALSGEIEDVQKALQALRKLNNGSTIHLLQGMELDLLEPKSANWKTIQELHEAVERAMQILILGQVQTTDGGPAGSLAKAKVQNEVRHDRTEGDAEVFHEPTHAEVLVPYYRISQRIPDPDKVPWVRWLVIAPEDALVRANERKADAEAVTAAADAIVKLKSLVGEDGIDLVLARKRYALPVLEEAKLKPPAPPPVLPGTPPIKGALPPMAEDDEEEPPPRKPRKGKAALAQDFTEAPGMVEGQAYADRLAHARPGIPGLTALVQVVAQAESPADLRARLLAVYGQMDPARLQKRLTLALVLAELAGRLSVLQDIDAQSEGP